MTSTRTGLIAWDAEISPAEVWEQATSLAGRLRTRNLASSGPVAVMARNSAQTIVAYLATVLSGATLVPLNIHLGHEELAVMLGDAGVDHVIVDDTTHELVAAAADRSGRRIGVLPLRLGHDSTVLIGDLADEEVTTLDRVAAPMLFSSGTTGRPKRVRMPPFLFPDGSTIEEFRAWARSSRFAPYGPHLVSGPLYHSGPLQAVWLLAVGVTIIIPRRFGAIEILETIERERVATTLMVPTHFVRLLKARDEAHRIFDVSSLKHVTQTGSGCPEQVKREMLAWWGPIFMETYGGTESGGLCFISSEEWLSHPGSVGRSRPGIRAFAAAGDGTELPPGEEGRLWFEDASGRGIRYEDEPQLTARAHLRPGVFTLGEVGRVDSEGYVYITDRDTDKVVSGGVNLYPAECERVLETHPDVVDVAAIGVPNPEMGEELRALVVLRSGASVSPEDLIEYCRENLSSLKAPRSVLIVGDLQRTPMGKLNRRELRARYGNESVVA
jgi:long-chain acyl-CoA synthetase